MNGSIKDLRYSAPSGPVKVFKDGKLVRVEKGAHIDDLESKGPRVSRRDQLSSLPRY